MLKINGIHNGSYKLLNDEDLKFNCKFKEFIKTDKSDNDILIIDKKSALEIAYTLLDSMNMLNSSLENLMFEIEKKIEGEE